MVGALDLGITTGLGCFETMLAIDGVVQDWPDHRKRLLEGLEQLGIPVEEPDWQMAFREVLSANELAKGEARVRVTVQATAAEEGTFFRAAASRVMVAAVRYRKLTGSVRLVTSPFTRNSQSALAGVKCLSYADSVVILNAAQAAGGDEAMIGNERGEICEAATANVFFCLEGKWFTPPLSSGCLGGVERSKVIAAAKQRGESICEEAVPMARVGEIEQAFLTSSLRGEQPVASIDGRELA